MNGLFSKITAKNYCLNFVSLLSLLICGIAVFNYTVDLQGIFRDDDRTYDTPPNQNFTKVRYLCRHPDRFDSFVFGSSRVSSIDIRRIPGGHWYNMTYSEGVPHEHLLNIAYLLRRGIKIKNILVGLDEFSFTIDPNSHLSQLGRMPYSPVINQSVARFNLNYLLRIPSMRVLGEHLRIWRKDKVNRLGRFNLSDGGVPASEETEQYIEKNRAKHVNDKKFLVPTHLTRVNVDNLDGTLNDIRELVMLARQHGINLVIFINPIHQATYRDIDIKTFFDFKRKLAQLTDYYDFSGLNSFVRNNYYFYETAHYRPILGDRIIARIFGSANNNQDADFGILVTAENVSSHLNRQCAELRTVNAAMSNPDKRGKNAF